MVTVLSLLGAVFVTENLFQTLLPVSLDANGLGSGLVVGTLLAVAQGLGIACSPPAAAWADAHGRGPVLRAGAVAIAVATLVLGVVSYGATWWMWLLPVVLYGTARTATMTNAITLVTMTGDPLRIQGFNGAVQRAAAAVAAVVAAAVIAAHQWHWGFWLMTCCSAAVVPLAFRAAPRRRPAAPAVPTWQSYRRSFAMLRERPIQASSLINVNNFAVMLLGNSFYPLALDVPRDELGAWVLALLLCRDLTSVVTGPAFRPLARRLGLRAVMIAVGSCNAAGLCLVALLGANVAGVVTAAVLQGFAMSLAIGTTNILATRSGGGGSGLRIVATNYVGSVGAVLLPIGFGVVYDATGPRVLFLVGAGVVAVLALLVLWLARAWMDHNRHALAAGRWEAHDPA